MPIPLPNLDDRSYADLTAEAQALIPGLCREWTHHNPGDPGIVLVELLAWLTEMTLYRLNAVPAENVETFLTLLGWEKPTDKPPDLDAAVRETILKLREPYRAVTARDFERLAVEPWSKTKAATRLREELIGRLQAKYGYAKEMAEQAVDKVEAGKIKRVRCVPQRNLAAGDPKVRNSPAPAHLSVVILPDTEDPYGDPSRELLDALHEFFSARCLLTTRHHIVGPTYLPVELSATLFLREDAPPEATLNRAIEALYAFFHPVGGGPEGTGWPFGRNVYVSEVYALFDELDLVDYVEAVSLKVSVDGARLQKEGETVVGVTLDAHELVAIEVKESLWQTTRSRLMSKSESVSSTANTCKSRTSSTSRNITSTGSAATTACCTSPASPTV